MGQIWEKHKQICGKSETKESGAVTSVLAAVPPRWPSGSSNGWMDRSSNAPRVSNGLAVMFCNAPLSDGAKVYLRSVTRLNPACYTLLLSNGIWLPPCSGVWSPREVGVRQCEHASPSLVTPRVTMSALDTGSTPQCSRVQYTWSCVSCIHICTGVAQSEKVRYRIMQIENLR